MLTLFYQSFCPHSRFVRLVLAEAGLPFEGVEIKAGRENAKLMAVSPDGATPALLDDNGLGAPGEDIIVATLEETYPDIFGRAALLPASAAARLEVRRLARWFNGKMYQEASRWILREKIEKRFLPASQGGGAPDMDVVRAARENLRYHCATSAASPKRETGWRAIGCPTRTWRRRRNCLASTISAMRLGTAMKRRCHGTRG